MQVLISYEDEGRIKVDGPFDSYKEVTHRIVMLEREGFSDVALHRIDLVCDFCSRSQVAWKFQIEPGGVIHAADSMHVDNDGTWGACEGCSQLIREQNFTGLAKRSFEHAQTMPESQEVPAIAIAEMIAEAHALFWSRYKGDEPERVISDAMVVGGDDAD
jgi:hypothetical protein